MYISVFWIQYIGLQSSDEGKKMSKKERQFKAVSLRFMKIEVTFDVWLEV